ncbi:MAG TPA: tetratricopeptide repeat protein, partial [Verrucomicrobium sp.]|nr:tetratricopeptide repeat protein [Verrucomicrobium sp.]
YVMGRWSSEEWQENPMYPLIAIIFLAVAGGIFFVMVILPKIGDAVGTVMYSSGEEIQQDEGMKAVAFLAKGDYQGAINEYEKMTREKPEDAFPVSEIAKIYSDKLNDSDKAIAFIQENLEGREWTEDNASFLMFRIVDLHMTAKRYDDAKDILEQVVGNFPGTRHSANAKHRINEVEQLQYKEMAAARAKQSSSGTLGA